MIAFKPACLSLLIALIVTPWLSLKLLRRHGDPGGHAYR